MLAAHSSKHNISKIMKEKIEKKKKRRKDANAHNITYIKTEAQSVLHITQ